MTECGLEIAMEDGTWERVGARVFRGDAMVRPAPHDWEAIPPHYARCRVCGAVTTHDFGTVDEEA